MIKRRPLIWQLYPSFLMLILIAMLATGWFASRAMRALYITELQQDLIYQIRILAPQIQPLIAPLDGPSLDRFCKQIALALPMRLTIMLPDGTVVGDSEADPGQMENHGDRPEVRQATQGQTGNAFRFSQTINRKMMYMALPIGRQPVLGVARLAIPLTAIDQPLFALRMRLAAGGLVIAVLAALVCLMISRRITRPIEAMRRGAARFAEGELSHRLAAPATLELAGLAQAMNQMAQELEQRMLAILRERNESEAVLSSMVEGVVALDPDEHILHLNTAAARLLGTDEKQLQGRSIQEVVRNRELHDMIRTTLDQGVATQADVALYRLGEQILNAHCTPLFDADGRRMGALLVVNEVTQLRRLETMRSDFAANVSHEIKTPLTAIQGFVETLTQGAVTDPQESQRYSPDKSRITVTARIVEEEIRISVADEGIGVAAAHLPRLFERFYRVDKSRSRRMGGTGLGLAIVKHIVQAHGGRVTVRSIQGKGTTFTIHLPWRHP
ncbi:MAG: PAS domain-containing protein [Desulfatitalea sp.]|nr:PAS domain-containing protein [Desulfatitalea sp.]